MRNFKVLSLVLIAGLVLIACFDTKPIVVDLTATPTYSGSLAPIEGVDITDYEDSPQVATLCGKAKICVGLVEEAPVPGLIVYSGGNIIECTPGYYAPVCYDSESETITVTEKNTTLTHISYGCTEHWITFLIPEPTDEEKAEIHKRCDGLVITQPDLPEKEVL